VPANVQQDAILHIKHRFLPAQARPQIILKHYLPNKKQIVVLLQSSQQRYHL